MVADVGLKAHRTATCKHRKRQHANEAFAGLDAKEVKDHLPMDPQEEAARALGPCGGY